MHCLAVLEAGSLRVKRQQGWFLLRAGRLFPVPGGLLAATVIPCLVEESPQSLTSSAHGLLTVFMLVSKFPLSCDTRHVEQLIISTMILFPSEVTF